MTDPKKIFGTKPRSMLEFVGWLFNDHNSSFKSYCELIGASPWRDETGVKLLMIDEAHEFLSQPMEESWFVRPEEPEVGRNKKYDTHDTTPESIAWHHEWHERRKLYDNWQPLFKGEWDLTSLGYLIYNEDTEDKAGFWIGELKTLNDFLTHCEKQGIELEFN